MPSMTQNIIRSQSVAANAYLFCTLAVALAMHCCAYMWLIIDCCRCRSVAARLVHDPGLNISVYISYKP